MVKNSSNSSSDNYLRKREQKTAKRLGIVVACFIICWLPFFTAYVFTPFIPQSWMIPDWVYAFFTWLGWVNSSLNPLLYGFFDLQFRMAFKRLILDLFCGGVGGGRRSVRSNGSKGSWKSMRKRASMVRMTKKVTVRVNSIEEKVV